MTADPYLGRTIDDRYAIHRLLGRGGMGAVYEARHEGLDRRVAVKFLLSDQATASELERFRREARAASRIHHENVVQIYDTGTDRGVAFIAMELVDGMDLKRLLTDEKQLAPDRAVALTRQILAGLGAIHDAGIVHRDIKPGNVVVTRADGREIVKIMDFGIAKSREPGLTGVGSAIGTPEYMAPEQRTGRDVDHRADLYAVGLTLHQMLTGQLPAEAMTVGRTQVGGVPAEIERVLERALAWNLDERFQNARDFAAALFDPALAATQVSGSARGIGTDATIASGTGAARTARDSPRAIEHRRGSAEPTTPQASPRRGWAVPVLAVAALAIGGIVAWKLLDRTPPPPVATPAVVESDATAPPGERELEYARNAEAAGKIELAIAAYEEAQRHTGTAPIAFKLGELYERIDNKAAAARAFGRYLVLAPEASDRAVVENRIAALSAVPNDAGVPDAGVRVVTKPVPKGKHCMCFGGVGESVSLCPSRGKQPLCECRVKSKIGFGQRLCAVPLENGTCPDPDFGTKRPGHEPDDACNGYNSRGERQGNYACSWCVGAQLRSYRGAEGGACTGFVRHTGEAVKGTLLYCEDAPPSDRTIEKAR